MTGRLKHTPIDPRSQESPRLAEYRDGLYKRLEAGYERIETGLAEGKEVVEWEDFWIALLREYERVCDELSHRARV